MKIGFSKSVARRFEQISPLMPGLRVLGYLPGTRGTESWLHARFAAHRERGEWFRQHDELRNFITHGGLLQLAPAPPKRARKQKPARVPKPRPVALPQPEKDAAAVALAARRAQSLTPERRQEIAQKAIQTRWAKAKKKDSSTSSKRKKEQS